jgi:oligoendopeptidase F
MVSHLLSDIKNFEEELMRESLAHNVGFKDEMNSEKIFKKFPHLFSKDHIKEAKTLLDNAKTDEEKRKARLVYAFLVSAYVGNELKKISDEASTYEAKAKVKIDDKEVAYRQIPSMIMNEDERSKRKAMFLAMVPVKEKLTEYDKHLWAEDYRLIKELTGLSYIEFCSMENEVDYDPLAELLRQFLVKTEKIYERAMRRQFLKIGINLEDAHPWDFAYLARAKHFDEFFKKEEILPIAKKFWSGLGIDIENQENVKIDIEEREKKRPRAFCMPVKIPHEVHLVIKPRGGQDDFQAFLHESGHTEHFAHASDDLAYELKHMGPHTVSESYAFLCEYLMANETWLKEYLKMPEDKAI